MLRNTQLIKSGKVEIKEAEFLSSGSGETIIEVQNAGVSGTEIALLQDD
jgi:hypothetical protein